MVALRRLIASVDVELGASFYASALPLTLHQRSQRHVNQILYWFKKQMYANTGDAYETPRHGYIKGATKVRSEYVCFPLTLTLHERIKGAPALYIILV